MKKFRLTIGNKILGGFLILIVFFAINAVVIVLTVNSNDATINQSSVIIKPTVNALKEFQLLVTRSKMFATNWVYLPSDTEAKESLQLLHEAEYPELKESLEELSQSWEDEEQVQLLDTIFTKMEGFLGVQQEIMSELVTFEDYEDPLKKFTMIELIESSILPQSNEINEDINRLTAIKQAEDAEADLLIQQSSSRLKTTTIVMVVVITILGLLLAFYMSRSITSPINFVKGIIQKLGRGELPEDKSRKFSDDEVGEMAMAVDSLVNGLKSTSYFAEDIGKGNYSASFEPLSDHDVLGNALLNMRDNLRAVADEDKRRNWATEGLAKFGEILRKHQDNLEKLSDEIISNLVSYMNANQGGLFIINDEDTDDPHLRLAACYAWDKKKYLEQKIYEGEGLTGQAWLEKDTVYLTEVPDDYINITSGLGEANPRSILIVPLKVNEEIYGVIEIASFKQYEKYQIEFVEKIAESIASTISSVKINEKTQKLLEESTEMTEQMRSQEEEMRQNMEELQATQEEMERNQKENEAKERIINSTNLILELDSNFAITSSNDLSKSLLGYDSNDLSGKPIESIVFNKDKLEMLRATVSNNKVWSGTMTFINARKDQVNFNIAAGSADDPYSGAKKFLLFGASMNSSN